MTTLKQQVSLADYNTLRIDACAAWFCRIDSKAALISLLRTPAVTEKGGILVIGGGSNLVLTRDFPGLVLLNAIKGIDVVHQDSDSVMVSVGGGENWDAFVAYSLSQGWAGLENLSAIPGTVGAAPIQNIGAYGVERKDCLVSVSTVELVSGQVRQFDRQECEFGYRDSIFKKAEKDKHIITSVTFRLDKRPTLKLNYGEIRSEMDASRISEKELTPVQLRQLISTIRARKLPDPKVTPNVGSFFKNPVIGKKQLQTILESFPDLVYFPATDNDDVKLAAGWMIDRLGWKGKVLGMARVHSRQALVLTVREGHCEDLLTLAKSIQKDVSAHFGVVLEIEPRIV